MNAGNMKFSEILKDVITTYGKDLILDSHRMNALLMDLAPNHSRERKLVCSVLREGIGAELLSVVSESEENQKRCIKKCVIQVKNDTWIAEEAAEFAIQVISSSIGINCEIKAPSRSRKPDTSNKESERKTLIKGEFSGGAQNIGQILQAYNEIGYKAFSANSELKEIIVPDTVTIIRSRAFQNCVNLETVQLPSSLESLGGCVFYGCSKLRSIKLLNNKTYGVINGMLVNKQSKTLIRFQNEQGHNKCQIPGEIASIEPYAFDRSPVGQIILPKSTSKIKQNAFNQCMNLQEICVDPKNLSFTSIDGVLHSKNRKKLLRYPSGKRTGNYFVEDGVEEISDCAFSGAGFLESITFTNDVKKIGTRAFENCNRIESLLLPASVEVIGERAFQGCEKLSSVMLPRSITEIGDFAFFDCKSITTISVPQKVQRIGHAAFKDCESLRRVVIQREVRFLGDGVFDGCSSELEICIRDNQYIESFCRARGIKVTKV